MSYFNGLVLIAILGAVLLRAQTVISNQSQVVQRRFPVDATNYIQEHAPSGNLYNTYGWGGYLIWRLYPSYRVYIDGRADIYGDKFIEEYLEIYRAKPGWEQALKSRGINLALIEPDSALANAMSATPDWVRIYADTMSVVLQRK